MAICVCIYTAHKYINISNVTWLAMVQLENSQLYNGKGYMYLVETIPPISNVHLSPG